MPILNQQDKQAGMRYDDFIKNSPYATATQDRNWSMVKSNWQSEQVYLQKNGQIIAAMSLLVKQTWGISLLYAPRGPIGNVRDIAVMKALIEEAKPLVKKYHAYALRFDPEIAYDEPLLQRYKQEGYRIRGRNTDQDSLIQPRYNMILNLRNKTKELLLQEFSAKTRYNIHLAKRKNITVTNSHSEADLRVFYQIYRVTCDRNQIGYRSYDYFVQMCKAYDEKQLCIYIAYHEQEALSAAIMIVYGKKAWYCYGGSTNEKRNYMPNYLMQYEMILWGMETGCESYDFGGVYQLDKTNGLYKFKEGFCHQQGATEFLGELDVVYHKFFYFCFVSLLPAYKRIKRAIRTCFASR